MSEHLGPITNDVGILPGDAYTHDLWNTCPEHFTEWINDEEVTSWSIDQTRAQLERLFPEMDVCDRQYMTSGLVIGQAWFYLEMLRVVEDQYGGDIPDILEEVFQRQEDQITRLVTSLSYEY